jgi:hypothetical protein
MRIVLPASLQDDLNWKQELSLAEKQKGKVIWEFALGLRDLSDPAFFQSYVIAMDLFKEKVWPLFGASSEAVSLYRGGLISCDEELFQEWLQDLYAEKSPLNLVGRMRQHLYRVFCLNALLEYLHRLGSYLPDSVPLLVEIQLPEGMTRAEAAHLLSKERFGHLQTALAPLQSSVALCLPAEEEMTLPVLRELDELIDSLEEEQIAFRIIPEALLTEEWEGLDRLFVLEKTLTAQGKRRLQGFTAAGGEVVYH